MRRPAMKVVALATLLPPLLFSSAFSGIARAAEPQHISLPQAIDLAIRNSVDLRAADANDVAAGFDRKSARSALGPRLRVEANVYVWDSPFQAAIMLAPGQPSINFPIRDQVTETTTLSIAQPLTPLYPLAQVYYARTAAAEAAHAAGETARAELVFAVTRSYLDLLQAGDFYRITDETVRDITEQTRTTKALVEAGNLIQADLLRTQVALAQAQQERLRAEAQLGTARAALATALGLPVETELDPERLDEGKLPQPATSAEADVATAYKNRPELAAEKARAEAASHASKAAFSELFPNVTVLAAYQRNDGFTIQQTNAAFVGGALQWDFWEWGTKFYASEAAKARANMATLGVERERRQVAFEVVRRRLDAKAALSAVAVARTAIDQAREAYRVTKALYENGSATTTDLLDAQLALERTRLNDARSLYDAWAAFAALARATGVAQ